MSPPHESSIAQSLVSAPDPLLVEIILFPHHIAITGVKAPGH